MKPPRHKSSPDVLNISPDLVKVKPGFDTEQNAYTGHTGTYASQFAVTGLAAIHGAAEKLRKEMSRLAAWALKAKEKNLEFGIGAQGPEVRVKRHEEIDQLLGARKYRQREQRWDAGRFVGRHAELPPRLPRTVPIAGHQAQVRQSHTHVRGADSRRSNRSGSRNVPAENSRLRLRG